MRKNSWKDRMNVLLKKKEMGHQRLAQGNRIEPMAA